MENKKRLIHERERANLIRCLKKLHDLDFTPGVYEHSVIGRAALFLEETADAVEVVRCKDCRHWQKSVDGVTTWCPMLMDKKTKADDFCSYGERRATE